MFFFDIEFCIDFLKLFGPKINQTGSQSILCGHPFWLPKSTLVPKATFGCTLVAFRLPFACFEFHLNRFGLHFVTFGVRLATFRVHGDTFSLLRLPFGTLFAPFFAFLNVENLLSFFCSFGLLAVPFLVALPVQIQFWGTQRRKTHSKIIRESQP